VSGDYRSCRQSHVPAARRRLNPFLRRTIRRSGKKSVDLAVVAGFPHKQTLSLVLREERVPATPLLVVRLTRLADAVGFPREDIFLPEAMR
jgi:hypothetical protein